MLNVDQTGRAKGSGTLKLTDEPMGDITVQPKESEEDLKNRVRNDPNYDERLFKLLSGMDTTK